MIALIWIGLFAIVLVPLGWAIGDWVGAICGLVLAVLVGLIVGGACVAAGDADGVEGDG